MASYGDGNATARISNTWFCWSADCTDTNCPYLKLVIFCGECDACKGVIPAAPV